jgi:hypothetical protein
MLCGLPFFSARDNVGLSHKDKEAMSYHFIG